MQKEPGAGPLSSDPPSDEGDRRSFLRSLGQNAMRSAVDVAATVDVVRRVPARLAANLLPEEVVDSASSQLAMQRGGYTLDLDRSPRVVASEPATTPDDQDRLRPYRLSDNTLYVLDLRELPSRTRELRCPSAAALAAAIQGFAVGGGPVLGEIAAYGVALAARSQVDRPPDYVLAFLGWTIGLLRDARPSSAPMQHALDGIQSLLEEFEVERTTEELVALVDAAAERFARHVTVACDDLARAGAAVLGDGSRPLRVLTIGTGGQTTGGRRGTVAGILGELARTGGDLQVWIDE